MKRAFSIILFIALLGLEQSSFPMLVKLMPIILLSLFAAYNFAKFKKKRAARFPLPILLFVAVIAGGVIRNNNPNTSVFYELNKFSIFFMVVLTAIQTVRYGEKGGPITKPSKLLSMLYFPLLGLVAINLLGYLMGFQSSNTEDINLGEAVFLSRLGIVLTRVSFPFATGFNTYSTIVGIILTISLFGISHFKIYRKWMIIGIALSTITLLLIDTRSALIYPYLLYFASKFFFRSTTKPKFTWLVPFIAVVGPIVMLTVLGAVSSIPQLAFLSRSSEDFTTANSRSVIWLFSSMEFLEFKAIHLIGYGEYGHYASGASSFWNDIFGQWGKKSDLITPHSTFYSILFDYGYVGLTVIIFFELRLIRIIQQIWYTQPELSIMALSILTYWNLVSITETCFGFYTPNILAVLMILAVIIFSFESIKKSKGHNNL